MSFLLENWHLLAFGAVVLAVLIWEVLKRKKPSTERWLRAIVILMATYGIAWMTQEIRQNRERNGDIDYFFSQISDMADNAYARGVLRELRERVTKFKGRNSEALSEAEVREELTKALKQAQHSAVFVDHYILAWNSHQDFVTKDNAAAVKRGLEVRRIWVISEAILRDSAQLKTAMDVMEGQKNLGIKTSFVLQRDLQSMHDYQKFADVDYALFDDEILAKVRARTAPDALPSYCVISWDKSTISGESPFTFITTMGVIRDFDTGTKAFLTSASKAAQQPKT